MISAAPIGGAASPQQRSVELTATPFAIDLAAGCLRKHGEPISLRPKTWKLLIYLIEHAGDLVSKEDILEHVWRGSSVAEEIISVSISELRRAFEDTGKGGHYIQTVHHRGYRFVAPFRESSEDSAEEQGVPFVSRRDELALLRQAVTKAAAAQRQLVLISGEAGIGKTTLVQRFLHEMTSREHDVVVATGQCFEEFRGEEPFRPVLDILGQLARSRIAADVLEALRSNAPTWLLQLPSTGHDEEHAELRRTWIGETHEQRLHHLIRALDEVFANHRVVLLIEDFHWSDSATADFVFQLAARSHPARLLLLCTQRPEDANAGNRPFASMLDVLAARRRCTKINLPRLSGSDIDQYLSQRFAGAAAPGSMSQWILRQTEGNPLFLVNVADELVHRQVIREQDGGWVFDTTSADFDDIPESLRSIIEHRCNCLSNEERPVLEAASITGVHFTDEAVEAVLGDGASERLAALARQRKMIGRVNDSRWPDGTIVTNYTFQHVLYRDALRDSVPVRRRVEWHQRIGNRIEAGFAAEPVSVAADLVEHFDQALEPARSANYLVTLGVNAVQRYSYAEGILYFRNAYERLQDLRGYDEYKLFLLRGLVAATMGSTGYGSEECGSYLRQIHDLVAPRGDVEDRGWLTGAMAGWHALRGEHRSSLPLAEESIALAVPAASEYFFLWGNFLASIENAFIGELQRSIEQYRAGAARFDALRNERANPNIPPEAKTLGMCGASLAMFLTDSRGAVDLIQQAQRYSRDEIRNPFGRLLSLCLEALFHALLGDFDKARACGEEAIAETEGRGLPPFGDLGRIVVGWCQVMQGRPEELAGMEAAWQNHKQHLGFGQTPSLLLLAQARRQTGDLQGAMAAVNEALEFGERNDERLFEPELLGLRAELTMEQAGAKAERVKRARSDLARARTHASRCGMTMWLERTDARSAALFKKP